MLKLKSTNFMVSISDYPLRLVTCFEVLFMPPEAAERCHSRSWPDHNDGSFHLYWQVETVSTVVQEFSQILVF